MTSRKRMEDSERGRAVGSIEAGQSITDVALFFGVHHSVISRLWKQFQTTQAVVRRALGGRPRVTTPAEDWYIAIVAKGNRRATSTRETFMVTASIGGSIMVWAGVSLGYRTDLHSVMAIRYREEVLEPIVRLYAAAVGPTFVLMNDNASPHRAEIVDDYLESEGIEPTLIELETALQEEWRLLNSAVVDHLIESMIDEIDRFHPGSSGDTRSSNILFWGEMWQWHHPGGPGGTRTKSRKAYGGWPDLILDGDRFNSCQVIYSQFGLAIHQNDHQARHRFVEWPQNEIAVVPDFHKQILFSDEAHFWLNGYVNKQNCRIRSEANPQVYVETPLHPEKPTGWCALWAGGIIGPYFFKNDGGHNVTVNGDRYRAIITNFFIPKLNNHDVQELWFQQHGATCHTPRATIVLLKDTFGDRLISRFGPVNWPPRSCD
ncbi:putative DD41D transposase [Trichonephila clavipes]|nr:putative DD41D transposase [Trichonephila clavipes]